MRQWLALLSFVLLLTAAGLTACDNAQVYTHYEHTSLSGWEKNDTLIFPTPRFRETGRYHLEVGLRTTSDYPFTGLTLKIEQRIFPGDRNKTYFLACPLMEKNGDIKGQGVNYYQYTFPLGDLILHEGDSLRFILRHDMKREILPGIADVGILITRR